MTEEIKKWWEDNANQFQEERKIPIEINYGAGGLKEDDLKLIKEIRGKKVLEIGCGGAQCGIAFAKQGAIVTGIDISEKQIEFARQLAKDNNVEIELYQGDIINLEKINSESQDIIFSSWALLYISDLQRCFKEAYRVLKKGGLFVLSLDHPFWRTLDKKNMKLNRCYFETGIYQEPYLNGTFMAYNHTISEITNALADAGFIIEKMIEPDPRKSLDEDFWLEKYEDYKKEAMKKIPRTIIFKAKKY